MSSRAARVLRAIEESQAVALPEPTKPRRLRRPGVRDELPPEEQASLRLLAEFPGEVGRSPMGAMLDRQEDGYLGLARCPHCVDGWVWSNPRERVEWRRQFELSVAAYAEQALAELRREAERCGREFNEPFEAQRAQAIGRSRALDDETSIPSPRGSTCPVCDGSRLVPAPTAAEHGDPDCELCRGAGRISGPGTVVLTMSGIRLVKTTIRCRCLDLTVLETGSSIKVRSSNIDGPDPEWLARIGRLSRRMNGLAAVHALALEAWYSPSGGRIECLWPLTEAGQEAIRGLGRDTWTWRSQARVRKGREMLMERADYQAERLLVGARAAWMATLWGSK